MNITHEPTQATTAQVEALASYGVPQDDIAVYLDIDPKTLRKHYRRALDTAEIKANSLVAQSLFSKATKGEGAFAVTAAIFWLKTRAGWKEPPVDQNIKIVEADVVDYSKLPPEKAEALLALQNEAIALMEKQGRGDE